MAEIKIECQEDLEILKEIEEKIIKKVDIGFDPDVLQSLDQEDVPRSQIENLKNQLSDGVVTRLFGLGNSVHYGRLRAGKMTDFADVILRLGLGPSKIYILSLALFFLNSRREFTELAARSFIISFLGKMLAAKMGLKEEEVKKVEIGGIFLKVGKVFMLLYEQQMGKKLEETFISQYYPYLGMRAVEIFKLPEFLKEIISFSLLRFEERRFLGVQHRGSGPFHRRQELQKVWKIRHPIPHAGCGWHSLEQPRVHIGRSIGGDRVGVIPGNHSHPHPSPENSSSPKSLLLQIANKIKDDGIKKRPRNRRM